MWKSKAGTVTVSLVLMLAPLFTFHAALIDAARVKMGERQAEAATKVALRSVLSAYDPALRDYGLFAVGIDPNASRELFSAVFKENLGQSADGAFQLVKPVPASETVQTLHTLGNRAVFGRQVLEEMKYRAPVEFALSVTDKLKTQSGAASMLNGMSQFAERAEQIESLIAQREDELDSAWATAQEMSRKAGLFRDYYARKLARLDELCGLIGLRSAEEVRRSIQSLQAQAGSIRQTIRERQETIAGMLRAGVQAAEQIMAIQQSIGDLERSLNELNREIGELEQILQYIAEYTLLMSATKLEAERDRTVLAGMSQSVFERLDRAKSLDEQIRSGPAAPADSGIPPETLQAQTMPDSYYVTYKTGVGAIGALFSGFETALSATTLFVGDNKFDSVRMQLLSASNEAYGDKAAQFASEQKAEEDKRAAAGDSISKRKREEKKRFAGLWDEVRKMWAECGGDSSETYKLLETGDAEAGTVSLYRKYADYNRVETVPAPEGGELGDAETAIRRTTGMIDKLLDGIAAAAGQFRDELYYNEYALTKFNYRTYGKEKGPDGSPKPDYESSRRGGHRLQGQEAEYILYGLNSCLQNQSAAFTEMFSIRLAVRTAEALLSPDSKVVAMGNPMLTLLWALAEGAGRAFVDMTKLVDGEEVRVTDKAPASVTMGYKDYLRLFLLLHTKRDPMTARMQSLIDLNTGTDLRESAVYVQARTETKVRLWFMPFTLAAFGYPVQGNGATVTKTAVLSY
ncbi:hypothetical protein [Paenibacillus sp. GYB003]|uniref:hypothetical protein n=1 Tax=Paenibacillus sp. GYB003 TaxID=2994392 RepID=UPI002F96C44C